MTYAFDDITVTTWGRRDGRGIWRARNGDHTAEFFAERDLDVVDLYRLGLAALGIEDDGPNAPDQPPLVELADA